MFLTIPDKLFVEETKHLKALNGNGSSEWSALTILNNEEKYIIIHNPTHSKLRQEKNIMHELAHIICKHKPEKLEPRENFPFLLRDYNNVDQEEEAKWLGCLFTVT